MADDELSNYTVGFGLSFVIFALFNAILNIFKELVTPFKDWMASIPPLTHHWATHGIMVILLFLILGFVFSKNAGTVEKYSSNDKLYKWSIYSTLIGMAIIAIFYFIEGILLHEA